MQGLNLRLLACEARCHFDEIRLNTRFDNLLYHLTLPFVGRFIHKACVGVKSRDRPHWVDSLALRALAGTGSPRPAHRT
jgi:hypothetical protein